MEVSPVDFVMASVQDEQNAFGIEKIIDCKMGDEGQQMYKVKWQSTWEPVENLAGCQNLVDEFWSHVNLAKKNEELAQRIKNQLERQKGSNNFFFSRLSDVAKNEVEELVSRTNATSVRDVLTLEDDNNNNLTLSPEKEEMSIAGDGQRVLKSSFSEDIDNPYVRIAYLCKICSKEQSKKFKFDWKRHYLTHTAGPKPHVCHVCGKDFAQRGLLNKHMKNHGNVAVQGNNGIQSLHNSSKDLCDVNLVEDDTIYLD